MHRRVLAIVAALFLAGGSIALTAPPALAKEKGHNCPNPVGHYPPGQCKFKASKTTAPQGGQITVSGSGYSKNCTTSILLNEVTIKTLKTNNKGDFAGPVTIPNNAKVGKGKLAADDGCMNPPFEMALDFTVTKKTSSSSFAGLPRTNFPNLPLTGYMLVPTVAFAGLLVAGGVALVRSGRRRRIRPSRA